jgi:arginyl-tRNA synthetase
LEEPKSVILDFGGPNVAKALHVGHLRSAVIGESVRRIENFVGNKVISDVHLGDWGTPMGMIITGIKRKYPDLDFFEEGKIDGFSTECPIDVQELTEIYKEANIIGKEDEEFKEEARIATAKLQAGHPGYRALWKLFLKISVDDVKKIFDSLDAHFDLWWGESDAHQSALDMIEIAKKEKIAVIDDGALVIWLDENDNNKPNPPLIIEKSSGGFGYATTDIATIKMRAEQFNADEIIYFTDKRQSFYFEQVFKAASKFEFAKNVKARHVGFGTVNGKDGKPFKTRDGGVMNLSDLIELSKDKVRESMPTAAEVEGYDEAYIENLVNQVAIAAIKFQDLKNNIASGYVFEVDDFAKFEGKTGPYIQYAVARINSVLKKAAENSVKEGDVVVTNKEERDLLLKISQYSNAIYKAYEDKEPSIISDYTYSLAQSFSSFYNASSILKAESEEVANSRYAICRIVKDILTILLDLLGIEAPEVMLKKED